MEAKLECYITLGIGFLLPNLWALGVGCFVFNSVSLTLNQTEYISLLSLLYCGLILCLFLPIMLSLVENDFVFGST